MSALTILALAVGVVAASLILKGFTIVQQSETAVVERLGSFSRTLDPGINFVVPVIDKLRSIKVYRYEADSNGNPTRVMRTESRIDKRETVLNFPQQPVVTNDNVSVNIDGALYFQIEDAKRAAYEVENLVQAVEVLAKTTLRSVVGEMELDKLFSSRDEVNSKLQAVMDEAGNKWGVKVNRVEMEDISVPEDVENAMHQQMAAERSRRAQVTEASGTKEAEVLKADGEKQAAILRAEGERQAIENIVQGAQGVEPDEVLSYLLTTRYVDQLPNVAKNGERVFLPLESTSLLGSIGAIDGLAKNVPAAGAASAGLGSTKLGTSAGSSASAS